jgi:hypothetical protein
MSNGAKFISGQSNALSVVASKKLHFIHLSWATLPDSFTEKQRAIQKGSLSSTRFVVSQPPGQTIGTLTP